MEGHFCKFITKKNQRGISVNFHFKSLRDISVNFYLKNWSSNFVNILKIGKVPKKFKNNSRKF